MSEETKFGVGKLPLRRIRVIDGKHAHEVQGLPVPNEYGFDLFVHRNAAFVPDVYLLASVRTGMKIPGSEAADAFDCVMSGLILVEIHKDKIARLCEEHEVAYGDINSLPLVTLEQMELMRKEASA